MTPHTWIVENVYGGPLGDTDFWRCSGCGASGGPTCFTVRANGTEKPRWEPFLAGEGSRLRLSQDCDESATIIREHTLKRFEAFPKERKDISRHYSSLIRDVIRWTPDKKDVTVAYRIYWELQHNDPPPSFIDVREKLVQEGFNVMPQGGLTEAVKAIGQELYDRTRRGEE